MNPNNSLDATPARWASAAYLSAALLGINQILWGFYGLGSNGISAFSLLVTIAGIGLGLLSGALLVFAIVMTVFVVRAANHKGHSSEPRARTALSRAENGANSHELISRNRRIALGAAMMLTTLGVVAGGLLQTYSWNPRSKVPSLTLNEIYAEMERANQLPPEYLAWVWAIFWPAVALALTLLAASGRLATFFTERMMFITGLMVISGTTACHLGVSFGMSMSLADTFGVSGGATNDAFISMLGQLCAVVAIFLAIVPGSTSEGRLPKQTTLIEVS